MTDPFAKRNIQAAAAATVKPKAPTLMSGNVKPKGDNSDLGYPYPPKIWEKGYVAVPWHLTRG